MSIHENYIGCYSLSKTLQFQLKPVLETEENIKKHKILSNDEFRASTYTDVKRILDKCHKAFIDVSLSDLEIDWDSLCNAIFKYQKDNNKDELTKEQLKYQKLISTHLKKDDRFKDVSANVDKVVKPIATYI
jgi:CRISPR-associated protein Cpf1